MGNYDEIKCEYKLARAPKEVQHGIFQTKNFERLLNEYTITQDGRLIHHITKFIQVPEKKRPFYGKPEWKQPWGRFAGSMKRVHVKSVVLPYHGDIQFYTSTGSHDKKDFRWYEYIARFTHGKVEYIKRVK